jgi:hypothetical protein
MIDLVFTTVLDILRAAWKGSDTDEELWQARPLTGSEVSISRSSETPPTGHIEETAMHPSLSYYLAQADLRRRRAGPGQAEPVHRPRRRHEEGQPGTGGQGQVTGWAEGLRHQPRGLPRRDPGHARVRDRLRPPAFRNRDGLYATGKKGGAAHRGRWAARSGSRPGRR